MHVQALAAPSFWREKESVSIISVYVTGLFKVLFKCYSFMSLNVLSGNQPSVIVFIFFLIDEDSEGK